MVMGLGKAGILKDYVFKEAWVCLGVAIFRMCLRV